MTGGESHEVRTISILLLTLTKPTPAVRILSLRNQDGLILGFDSDRSTCVAGSGAG